ncbi:hypothetical protein BDR04DRAFT_1119604 [Suillus decipiens]|nr:hypothetical protein BDR04DRAFT_1119604 [Suillus decipiens]
MCITITPVEGPMKIILVPLVGECMCSEDKAHAICKLKGTIATHPSCNMAILGLVCKAQPYSSPNEDSDASKTLGQGNVMLLLEDFITKYFTPCTSITVAHHNWCHIKTVELFIWVQGDDESTINLDNQDAKHMACGWGLGKIRDTFIAFSKQLNPDVDCTELEEAVVTLPVRWKDYVTALSNGMDVTAWKMYKAWHEEIIKDQVLGGPGHSHGCSKHKHTNTSLPPPQKSKHIIY